MKLRTIAIYALTVHFWAFPSLSAGVPNGFSEIISKPGVKVYRKNYRGGNPDYVQVIDLSQGSSLRLMRGNKRFSGFGQGAYGGNNPSIDRRSLMAAWNSFYEKESNAVCIINGQFFSTNQYPSTTLAFPVVIDGEKIDGYGSYEFNNQKLVLSIKDNHAELSTFRENVQVLADNSIVGLTEGANKGPRNLTGRTFIGVSDKNNDGKNETIVIFSSKLATQNSAAQVLRDFSASDVVMLDGGGSTQLICEHQQLITSSRTIPQTIGVVSSKITYEEKCNVVIDYFEKKYSNYFPNGSGTISSNSGYYRYYLVKRTYNYLYAYNSFLYYKIGGQWYKGSSIEDWYSYLTNN